MKKSLVPSQHDQPDIDALVDMTVLTVAASSRRVYASSLNQWVAYCEHNHLDPLNLAPAPVMAYLKTLHVGKTTRQRHLSALRKLAQMVAILDYENPLRKALYESLTMIQAPDEGIAGTERRQRALSPDEVHTILETWGVETLADHRNRVLLHLLFATGLRRAELVALRWSDVDFEAGVLLVRHGKGNKARDVAIVGQRALDELQRWYDVTGSEWVWPELRPDGRGIARDKPISAQRIWEIIRVTAQRTGIEFGPHDARRTLITELLRNGASLADVQAQAGHARGDTTLRYARAVDAQARRRRFTVDW